MLFHTNVESRQKLTENFVQLSERGSNEGSLPHATHFLSSVAAGKAGDAESVWPIIPGLCRVAGHPELREEARRADDVEEIFRPYAAIQHNDHLQNHAAEALHMSSMLGTFEQHISGTFSHLPLLYPMDNVLK